MGHDYYFYNYIIFLMYFFHSSIRHLKTIPQEYILQVVNVLTMLNNTN